MAGHFGMQCCTDQDGEQYPFPCCPSASFECESLEITPELCGFDEFTEGGIVKSTPPKRYRRKDNHRTYDKTSRTCVCCSSKHVYTTSRNSSIYGEYDANDCGYTSNSPLQVDYSYGYTAWSPSDYGDDYPGDPCDCTPYSEDSTVSGYVNHTWFHLWSPGSVVSTVVRTDIDESSTQFSGNSGCSGESSNSRSETTEILSIEDTEDDARARETPEAGTSCSSLYSTRDTGYSWTERTSSYTITCSDLLIGHSYTVYPIVEKRTAVIGSEGEWQEATVASHTFTASATTEVLPAAALPHSQGWEYKITDVVIVGNC